VLDGDRTTCRSLLMQPHTRTSWASASSSRRMYVASGEQSRMQLRMEHASERASADLCFSPSTGDPPAAVARAASRTGARTESVPAMHGHGPRRRRFRPVVAVSVPSCGRRLTNPRPGAPSGWRAACGCVCIYTKPTTGARNRTPATARTAGLLRKCARAGELQH